MKKSMLIFAMLLSINFFFTSCDSKKCPKEYHMALDGRFVINADEDVYVSKEVYHKYDSIDNLVKENKITENESYVLLREVSLNYIKNFKN